MANHGYGYLERDMSSPTLYLLLDLCNREHFKNLLTIEGAGTDYFIVWAGDIRVFECWMEEPRQLEYRHGHAGDICWWFDGFFSSYIVNEIGGKIGDDGHGEIVEPDYFKRYPTYRHWVKNRYKMSSRFMSMVRWTMKYDKEGCPKELWKHINRKVEENGKKS